MEGPGARDRRLMYAGIGLFFALLLGFFFVYQVRVVALVFLMTLLFSAIAGAPVDFLERQGLGRAWGTMAVLGFLVFALALIGQGLGSVVADQARQLQETFPALIANVQDRFEQVQDRLNLEAGFFQPDPRRLLDSARGFLSGDAVYTVASLGAGVANVLSLGLVIFIATVYAVARPAPLISGFVSLFPAGWRERVREVLKELYETVQRWFLGQLASMAVIGVLSTIALAIIGVPFALLLGIISGVLAFVPYIGAVVSVVLPVLLALVSPEPLDALWVVVAYAGIQAVEGNLIQPVVMSRAVELHPAVVVFALLIFGTLFGLVGVFLAVPLVASLQVVVRELWIERMDEKGTDPNPPLRERHTEARDHAFRRRTLRLGRALTARFRRS